MRKLLAADFAQLLRDKVFWAAFAFMIVSTAILVVSTHNMIALDNYAPGTWTAETSMFCMLPSVGIVNAIWLHLFIGSDYDQGTIRNKFICGVTIIDGPAAANQRSAAVHGVFALFSLFCHIPFLLNISEI